MNNIIDTARQDFEALRALFHPIDSEIAQAVPEWSPADYLGAHWVSLCEDWALAMLGADHRFLASEIEAFNRIFDLHESPQDIAQMAAFIHQKDHLEDFLFQRLDRFVLATMELDRAYKRQITEKVLDYFLRLGEVMALIDSQYHHEENRLYQSLVQRIRKDWYQVGAYSQDASPALSLKLKDGSEYLYALSPY